jgi:hypothetical protein
MDSPQLTVKELLEENRRLRAWHEKDIARLTMDLRDKFARAALPAALEQEAIGDEGRPCIYDVDAVARVAYKLADAMLKAREAKP